MQNTLLITYQVSDMHVIVWPRNVLNKISSVEGLDPNAMLRDGAFGQ
jgi:hypothetical protein